MRMVGRRERIRARAVILGRMTLQEESGHPRKDDPTGEV